jgi:zeta-carotene desaturase
MLAEHPSRSFLTLRFLRLAEKVAIGRALWAIEREQPRDDVSMLEWLRRHRQPPGAIKRFWEPVLVSAINEELDRMAAAHGFQVFRLGFLAGGTACRMGVPAVPLGELYGTAILERIPNLQIHLRTPVESLEGFHADFIVLAVPFERVAALAPQLQLDLSQFEHSPITGIHLWFDRPVTQLPHATLLDRTIQWFFNKHRGRYLELVVSASRSLVDMPRQKVIDLGVRELAEFLPAVKQAKLEKAHVVKEVRATFSAKPGLESARPTAKTRIPNLFLAGDWTRTGWPATMEGAVRSGYLAAEAVTEAAGKPAKFLI